MARGRSVSEDGLARRVPRDPVKIELVRYRDDKALCRARGHSSSTVSAVSNPVEPHGHRRWGAGSLLRHQSLPARHPMPPRVLPRVERVKPESPCGDAAAQCENIMRHATDVPADAAVVAAKPFVGGCRRAMAI